MKIRKLISSDVAPSQASLRASFLSKDYLRWSSHYLTKLSPRWTPALDCWVNWEQRVYKGIKTFLRACCVLPPINGILLGSDILLYVKKDPLFIEMHNGINFWIRPIDRNQ